MESSQQQSALEDVCICGGRTDVVGTEALLERTNPTKFAVAALQDCRFVGCASELAMRKHGYAIVLQRRLGRPQAYMP
jgi:hypothetical protein